MNVRLLNAQRLLLIHRSSLHRLVRYLLQRANDLPHGPGWSEVSICLTDDAGISDVNRRFLGSDHVTDVISFEYAALPGLHTERPAAEIIVNVQQAQRLGRVASGIAHELALYLAHGINHLTGEEDTTPAARRRMRRRELRWLRGAARHRLMSTILRPDRTRNPLRTAGRR